MSSPITELMARVASLEHSQDATLREIAKLRGDHDGLAHLVHNMRDADAAFPTHTGQQDSAAMALPPQLRKPDSKPVNGALTMQQNGTASLPPHLRKPSSGGPLVTDRDFAKLRAAEHPAPEPTPPASPTPTFNLEIPRQSIEDTPVVQSGKAWMPRAITHMPSLDPSTLSKIPPLQDTVTFSYDFLTNTFGGAFWSPGLKYIPPSTGICILPTRSYYVLDAATDPFLPPTPGQHGAKLTPFFNANPEEMYGDQAAGSFDNVPMFILLAAGNSKGRYVYFGNYSQTRWSDKLDYDHMVDVVPESVKQYWAAELSAPGRADWISNALKRHFFPMPEYDGAIAPRRVVNATTIEQAGDDADNAGAKAMLKDVKMYAVDLASWDEDATLKTKLIKKDFILQAFERADADDPPALRLWWEYLQCVDYERDFYDTLVALQRRERHYF